MSKTKFWLWFWLIIATFIFSVFIGFSFFSTLDRNEAFLFLSNYVDESRRDYFSQLFTNDVARQARIGGRIFACFCLLLAIAIGLKAPKLAVKSAEFARYYAGLIRDSIAFWRQMPTIQKLITLGLFFLIGFHRLFTLIEFPITYDESYTYLHFCKTGAPIAVSYFPNTNNHVFFSLLGSLLCPISPFEPVLTLRIITLVVSLMAFLLLYRVLSVYFPFRTVLHTLIGSSVAFPIQIQHTQGRGYALCFFCFVAGIRILQLIYESKRCDRSRTVTPLWALFSVVNIIGFYTLSSYLYQAVTLYVLSAFFIWQDRRFCQIRPMIFSGLSVILVVVLLYLPIFAFNGTSAIFSNPNVKMQILSENLHKIGSHLTDTYDWLLGQRGVGVWLAFALTILAAFCRKEQRLALYISLIILFLPYLILVIHGVIPFQRLMGYLWIGFGLQAALILDRINRNKIGVIVCVSGVLFFTAQQFVVFNERSRVDFGHDFACKVLAEKLVREDVSSLYAFDTYYQNLVLYNEQQPFAKSIVQGANPPADGSCVWLIVGKEADRPPKGYELAFEDPYAFVYRKKRRLD